jgi:glycopeptide antibiotics resistance protein
MIPLKVSHKTWVYWYEISLNVLLFMILGFTVGFFIFSIHWMPTLLLSLAGVLAGAWIGTRNAKKKTQRSQKEI